MQRPSSLPSAAFVPAVRGVRPCRPGTSGAAAGRRVLALFTAGLRKRV